MPTFTPIGTVINTKSTISSRSSVTLVQNGTNADDTFWQIPNSMPIPWYGVNNTNIFVGSNSYVTIGAGTNIYTPNYSNVKGLVVASRDNSAGYVGYKSYPDYLLIHFEGGNTSSGGLSGTLCWDIKLFKDGVVELVTDTSARFQPGAGNTSFITNQVIPGYFTFTPVADTSYVFVPTSDMTGYTLTAGAHYELPILVQDTFTGADGTDIIGRTTEIGSKVWASYGGAAVWKINTNQAAPTTLAWDHAVYVDAGVYNNFSYSIKIGTYDAQQQIFYRVIDDLNYWVLQGGTLYYSIAGTWSYSKGVNSALTIASGDVIRIDVSGDVHTIFKNGTQIYTDTRSTHNTATATKFGFSGNSTTMRLDDFTVYTLTVTGNNYTKSLSDSISVTDTALTTQRIMSKSLSDTVTFSDSFTKVTTRTYTKALNDTLTLSETIEKAFQRKFADIVNIQEVNEGEIAVLAKQIIQKIHLQGEFQVKVYQDGELQKTIKIEAYL